MVSRPFCRFYRSPGGCRQGTNCKLAHTDPPATGQSSSASGSGGHNKPGDASNASNVPAGVCRTYWTRGICTRGAGCTYKHQSPDTSVELNQSSAAPSNVNLAANSTGVPHNVCREFWHSGSCGRRNRCRFEHRQDSKGGGSQPAINLQEHFQAVGLGNFPGLANDQFSASGTKATPGQTHYHLKQYTEDSFRFKIADQVYRFLELLCNASTQNGAWKADDGQTHLHETVKGNGILRIGDAIRFPGETDKPWSFQRGYIPILTYMSSEWVVKSTIHSDVNALYGLIHTNFEVLRNTIETHLGRLMAARSFKDSNRPLSGKQVFKVIFVTMFEYLTRFKQAKTTNPEVSGLVEQAADWFEEWADALKSIPLFDDECSGYEEDMKNCIVDNIRRDKDRALHLVRRGGALVVNSNPRPQNTPFSAEGLIANLQRNCDYEGPGDLREMGPRHDNDFSSFDMIRIAPTHEELMCEDDAYLPPNFAEAPHFLESKSVERLLDVQFRLLREELIAPVRMAVQLVVSDLSKPDSASTNLSKIIKAGGGRYSAPANAQESVIFSVFTNATFEPLVLNNRGTSVGVAFDAPPGQARSKQAATRAAYWEQVAKKRLMQGGLVALIWKDPHGVLDVYIGTISSSPRDLSDLARRSEDRVSLRVSFFDTAAELRIVAALQSRRENVGTRVLIEAPIFYEGIRPFLEALQTNPGYLPFSRYLCHQSDEELKRTQIMPPVYSLTPGFTFELKDLFPATAGVDSLTLRTGDAASVALARSTLIRGSRLDPSQADAIVDSLTREVSLIQGPPGTGKSYTCLELIRVLLKNQISPILLVAYTNHALDHMLKGVLDADITKNIIRLGSRYAADERIAQFTLDEAEKVQAKSKLDRSISAAYREMKSTETEMTELMKKISQREIPPEYIEEHVLSVYPYHYERLFSEPPSWISTLVIQAVEDQDGWETAGGRQQDLSILGFWVSGNDLAFLRPPPITQSAQVPAPQSVNPNRNMYEALAELSLEENQNYAPTLVDQHRAFVAEFMFQQGVGRIPTIPETNRALDELLADPNVWNMSLIERKTLHDVWYTAASQSIRQTQVEDFENLRQKHKDARRNFEEIKEQGKVNILRRTHIIGCTTTGAAKVVSLLSGIEPKVMVVEEAGQVLESHILASLVQSVQHLVMIGDPLQLRPSVNSYKLSYDNPKTGLIYRFDRSLMERLSDGGFPMSQLDVQRRMRPAISSLIKNTLYPKLQDHELVQQYPKVRGMHKDVFFVSHDNVEVGGGEDSVSKHNSYELDMIHDLVLHLLRQGCYSNQGNIVILAAYLGQIPKIRKKLQDVVTTIVDDRDSELLAQHGLEEEEVTTVQRVQVSSRVLIRTLDNFQGEEGEIIILSLVRNAGTPFDGTLSSLLSSGGRSRIGFLKSKNRTNVGLSRAKHGMYIFGNGPELARGSEMWASVLKELFDSDCLGKGLPISCHQHPDYVEIVDQPGRLKIVSPDGGCLQPCLAALPCGHKCPYKCHSDDPQHITTKCTEPCLRLCPLSHPCDRECWECSSVPGDCRFPVRKVPLPCGHTHPQAPCFLSRLPEKIKCVAMVKKKLLFCEHSASMPCNKDPATHVCQERCDVGYSCCSKSCAATCGSCQALNRKGSTQPQIGPISRTQHPKHPCGRILFCGHSCKDNCVEGHTCS
ncbi:P-loop containing nucleoside triphosphate hydrolase protein, partial [Ceratobasidium sp. AG-I]